MAFQSPHLLPHLFLPLFKFVDYHKPIKLTLFVYKNRLREQLQCSFSSPHPFQTLTGRRLGDFGVGFTQLHWQNPIGSQSQRLISLFWDPEVV